MDKMGKQQAVRMTILVFASIFFLMLVTGCATAPGISGAGEAYLDEAEQAISTKGAALSARIRVIGEFLTCKAITVGEWLRTYGSNPRKAQGWRDFCAEDIQELPSAPASRSR